MVTAGRSLRDVERVYLRRLRIALAFAAAIHAAAAISYPQRASFFPLPRRLGYEGPLRVYPELSVRRPEIGEKEMRAAPISPPGELTFRVENIDFGQVSARTGEELERKPFVREKHETRLSIEDDFGFAIRGKALPEVTAPEDYLLHLEKPVYPADALEQGLEGRVILRALVDTEGIVCRVLIEESHVSASMEKAAMDAVYKCRFRAYRKDGESTAFWARFPIAFRIVNALSPRSSSANP